jgi:hypothetical protein
MAQRRNDAALMVVQIKPRREEYVLRMALRRKVVPSRVVWTKPTRVEFVQYTEQTWHVNDVIMRGVLNIPRREEFVKHMVQLW